MTHPSSLDLEAFACEPVSTQVTAQARTTELATHVAACAECRAYVESLRSLIATGPSAKDATVAVARAEAEIRQPAAARRAGRGWFMATSALVPIAAALLFLLARPKPTHEPEPASSSSSAAAAPSVSGPDRILMAHVERPADPDTVFKGGVQVAVVRDRHGEQARFSSTVRVRAGDRLRVEVALDHEQAILGGVLADDGTFLELMPAALRSAGTHFSERSARIDSAPTSGTIVLGSPEAIVRVRQTKKLDGVRTLRVEWEGKP